MAITDHNNRTLLIIGILSIALLVLSGCKRSSLQAVNKRVLPGLSEPVRVSSGDANAAEPAIAASPDGSVYVVWVNHGPKSQADVMIVRFTSDGKMQGLPTRVNSKPGIATAWRGDPPTVAVTPDQTVLVGWTARVDSESGHASDIYLSSSKDHGQTFGAPVKVNDDPKPAIHGMHSLTVAKDGHIYVAWLDERNVTSLPMKDMKMDTQTSGHMENNREVFIAASTDGGHTFAKNQRVASNVCPCCKTSLATTSDGRLYLSWRQVLPGDFRHIAVASSPDHGQTFTPPKIVSDDQWVLAGCPVSGATLFAGNDGSVQALWYSEGKNGETGLYSSITKDQGVTFGPRQLVAAGGVRGTPVLVDRRGGLAAVWQGVENNSERVLITLWVGDAAVPPSFVVVTDAELPAAAANGERLFIAYVGKIANVGKAAAGQTVWLVSIAKPGLSGSISEGRARS
jgi:hypothetical protein